jgi:nitrogen fixation NifU-like protein
MIDELRTLYEEVILDHNRNPRNFNKIPKQCSHSAEGNNPLCGDHFTIYLTVQEGKIVDVGFKGAGCAISKASASLMLESIKGKRIEEVNELFRKMHHLLTDDGDFEDAEEDLGKLEALSGVKEFPMRVKCASLSWHIMNAAIKELERPITTE